MRAVLGRLRAPLVGLIVGATGMYVLLHSWVDDEVAPAGQLARTREGPRQAGAWRHAARPRGNQDSSHGGASGASVRQAAAPASDPLLAEDDPQAAERSRLERHRRIEALFREQEVDPAWSRRAAHDVETAFASTLRDLGLEANLRSTECRSHWCALDVSYPSGARRRNNRLLFTLTHSLYELHGVVIWILNDTTPRAWTGDGWRGTSNVQHQIYLRFKARAPPGAQ